MTPETKVKIIRYSVLGGVMLLIIGAVILTLHSLRGGGGGGSPSPGSTPCSRGVQGVCREGLICNTDFGCVTPNFTQCTANDQCTNGACVDKVCVCHDPHRWGKKCEEVCLTDSDCNNKQGTCSQGRCSCNTGWTGITCETQSTTNPCTEDNYQAKCGLGAEGCLTVQCQGKPNYPFDSLCKHMNVPDPAGTVDYTKAWSDRPGGNTAIKNWCELAPAWCEIVNVAPPKCVCDPRLYELGPDGKCVCQNKSLDPKPGWPCYLQPIRSGESATWVFSLNNFPALTTKLCPLRAVSGDVGYPIAAVPQNELNPGQPMKITKFVDNRAELGTDLQDGDQVQLTVPSPIDGTDLKIWSYLYFDGIRSFWATAHGQDLWNADSSNALVGGKSVDPVGGDPLSVYFGYGGVLWASNTMPVGDQAFSSSTWFIHKDPNYNPNPSDLNIYPDSKVTFTNLGPDQQTPGSVSNKELLVAGTNTFYNANWNRSGRRQTPWFLCDITGANYVPMLSVLEPNSEHRTSSSPVSIMLTLPPS